MDAQADIEAVMDGALKGPATLVSGDKQAVCPGCGRCRVCGHPSGPLRGWEQVPLYPHQVPSYPNWVTWTVPNTSTITYTCTLYA